MKKILYIILIIFICSGCSISSKNKLICTQENESELDTVVTEKMEIVFHSKFGKSVSSAEKIISMELLSPDLMNAQTNQIEEYAKESFCNSEADQYYQCNLYFKQLDLLVVEISGNTGDVIGIAEQYKIDDYKRIYEEKGFSCSYQ